MSSSVATPVTVDQLSLERLPNDILALKGLIVELCQALTEQRQRADKVQERLDALLRRLYGRRSERFDPQQPLLFTDADAVPQSSTPDSTAAEAAEREGRRQSRPGHGRQRLPEHLPRREVRHELTETERRCPCCGAVRAILGEEVSEQLEYIPASVIVKRHVRLTYVCRACERRRQEGPVEPAAVASVPPVAVDLGQSALTEASATTTPTPVILPPPSSVEVAGATLAPPVALGTGLAESVAGVAVVSATTGTFTEVSPTPKEDRNDPLRDVVALVLNNQDSNGSTSLMEPPSLDHGVTAPAPTTSRANMPVGDDGRTVAAALAPTGGLNGPSDISMARSTNGVPSGSTIITAPLPPQPWPRCLAGAGLLAYLVVSKFVDHLPLYRLERILLRDGVWLRRSTLCDWLAGCARVLEPLYQLLWQGVFQSGYVRTDDTSVRVQGQTTLGRLWAYLSGGQQRYTVYDFTLDHTQERPVSCLQEVQGYIQADGYKGYDKVYGVERIEVGCWAHARRYFFEARDQDPVRACYVLGMIGQLYAWEAAARYAQEVQEMSEKEYWDLREQIRERQAVPMLSQLGVYLKAERDQVLPLSKMGEAFRYLHNQWAALQVYVKHGFLEIDNNGAEQALRGIGIGRKNWLFLGSAEGGRTAAILYSITETCKQNGVDPWFYVREMLTILPGLTEAEREKALPRLLPDRWAQTQRNEADSRAPP